MTTPVFPTCVLGDLPARRAYPFAAGVLERVRAIVTDVERRGDVAVRRWGERLGDLVPGDDLIVRARTQEAAVASLSGADRAALQRTADRIRRFANAQRAALRDVAVPIPGGSAGHTFRAVARAGCYAPGGRYPLASTVLMTVITARVAGVPDVWVATPRPNATTLAAAAIGGAAGVLAVGGAQAIAALVFGVGPLAPRDVVVGPGNDYVTAAKHLLSARAAIDTLAGPSELVILADDTADPTLIAADLLAQAEHDPRALPLLVTTDPSLPGAVNAALRAQLATLPTAATARAALRNGGAVVVRDRASAVRTCNVIAPEHLQLAVRDPDALLPALEHFGTAFLNPCSGEVLGDYGAGPNHVLPTGGAARFQAGLSVMTFLRARTWLRIAEPGATGELVDDATWFARREGLEAHARAAERRRAHGGARAG